MLQALPDELPLDDNLLQVGGANDHEGAAGSGPGQRDHNAGHTANTEDQNAQYLVRLVPRQEPKQRASGRGRGRPKRQPVRLVDKTQPAEPQRAHAAPGPLTFEQLATQVRDQQPSGPQAWFLSAPSASAARLLAKLPNTTDGLGPLAVLSGFAAQHVDTDALLAARIVGPEWGLDVTPGVKAVCE